MDDDFNNYVKDYSLTDKQKVVVERYLKSTESFKAERMPLLKLLSMKNNISITNTIPVLPESDVDVRIPSKKTRLKVIDNLLVKNFLLEYDEYKDATKDHYWIDDVFTGCTSYRDWETDRKSTRLNSSHITRSRMPSSA